MSKVRSVMKGNPTLDTEKLRAGAGEALGVLRALAHEDRLLLLCEISRAERSVGELAERLDIRQPSLSQQLGVLRREGLVETRRQGKHIYYRIANADALVLLRTLYELYCSSHSRGNAND
jgi:DNA-binding transcriptional ArsR family regulator